MHPVLSKLFPMEPVHTAKRNFYGGGGDIHRGPYQPVKQQYYNGQQQPQPMMNGGYSKKQFFPFPPPNRKMEMPKERDARHSGEERSRQKKKKFEPRRQNQTPTTPKPIDTSATTVIAVTPRHGANCLINDIDVTPCPTPRTVISSTPVAGGGTIVSCKDEKGHVRVRVEYDRENMLKASQSPYALISPANMKNIVMETPEILAKFPLIYRPPSMKIRAHVNCSHHFE